MKKVLFTIMALLTLSFNASAISQKEALSEDGRNIIANIENNLGYEFKDSDKLNIYNKLFSGYIDYEGGWNMKPIAGVDFASISKVNKESNVTYIDYLFSYDQRTVSINLILFKEQKQLHVITKEIVPVPTDITFDIYNNLREDDEYEAVFEKDNYSMFLRKGYLKYKNFHVTEGESLIIHSDSYILDLK